MKILSTILIIIISNSLLAQKERTIEVCKANTWYIYATVSIDQSNNPGDTSYMLGGRDKRYTHLEKYILISYGEKDKILDFLEHVSLFIENEQDGISELYKGVRLSMIKTSGISVVMIYDSDQQGYTTLNTDTVKKLISGLNSFKKKN